MNFFFSLVWFTCNFLFIPVRLIIAPAFSASESGNLLSAAKLTVNSPELHSTGGRISAVDLELNLLKRLANGGSIIARNLALNTPDITNSGLIYGEAGYHCMTALISTTAATSSLVRPKLPPTASTAQAPSPVPSGQKSTSAASAAGKASPQANIWS